MCGSNYCFLTCIHVSQEIGKVVWYSHLFKNIPQFVVIHIVKGFTIVNETEVDIATLIISIAYTRELRLGESESRSVVSDSL